MTTPASGITSLLEPRYLARVPWGGAKRGERFRLGDADLVVITAPKDRQIGTPQMAAFLPMARDKGGRYFPAGKDGSEQNVSAVGWVQKLEGEFEDGGPLEVPVEWWRGQLSAVLILLLYNESPTFGGGGKFPLQVGEWLAVSPVAEGPFAGFDVSGNGDKLAVLLREPIRISHLPDKVKKAVSASIDAQLDQPQSELVPGLVELDV